MTNAEAKNIKLRIILITPFDVKFKAKRVHHLHERRDQPVSFKVSPVYRNISKFISDVNL